MLQDNEEVFPSSVVTTAALLFSAQIGKNQLSVLGESYSCNLAKPNDISITVPVNKHLQDVREDDIQCHPKTLTNDSIFLSIKDAVCNVASDLRGRWTPWHQTQYHVMVNLSPWVLINTRQRDHGQSSGHYHSSLSSLVCLFADVEERIITYCVN